MVAPGVGDIAKAVEIAFFLYDRAFSKINSASQQYREFGDDVQYLATNLKGLQKVIHRAQERLRDPFSASRLPTFEHLDQVIKGSRAVLGDCDRFLNNNAFYERKDGVVPNIVWGLFAGPEAKALRERIMFLNIKLTTILGTVDIQMLEKLSDQIEDARDRIESLIDIRFGKLFHHLGLPPTSESTTPIRIPVELGDRLTQVASQRFSPLNSIPVGPVLDAAIHHFAKAKGDDAILQEKISNISQIATILDLMISMWLLYTLKKSESYRRACSTLRGSPAEQNVEKLGMTVERFVEKLEEDIHLVFQNITNGVNLDDINQSLVSLFQERPSIQWSKEPNLLTDPLWESHLDRIMSVLLRSQFAEYTQTLNLYRQDEARLTLEISHKHIAGGPDKDKSKGVDLHNVRFLPLYAFSESPTAYNVSLQIDRNPATALCFVKKADLFRFQQAITGYQVVSDDTEVSVTTYESGAFLKGTSRTDRGRLQIWNVKDLTTEPSATAPTSPVQSASSDPISSFGGMSLNIERRRSTIQSTIAPSTTSLLPGNVTVQTSLINASRQYGVTLEMPGAPCMVFFLRHQGGDLVEPSTPGAYLALQFDEHIYINPRSCECNNPKSNCSRIVIESKASRLQASRFQTPSLAALGVSQLANAPKPIPKLKHVTIKFRSPEKREQFTKHFETWRAIYNQRLQDYHMAIEHFVAPGDPNITTKERLASPEKDVQLGLEKLTTMDHTRKQIIEGLTPHPVRKVSGQEPAQSHTANFQLAWDPFAFLHEQEYKEQPIGTQVRLDLPDGMKMDARVQSTKALGHSSFFTVTGPIDSVAENRG